MTTRILAFVSLLARRGALCALLGLMIASLASASGGGNNQSSSDPQASSSSPGDDVTSLPLVGPSGMTLIGSPRALRAVVLGSVGGELTIQRLAPGLLAATFSGSLQLRLDRAVLASGQVMVAYRGGADETGTLTFVGGAPTIVETERLPLPLARMAASTLMGPWLRLQAISDSGVTSVDVAADRAAVTLTQLVR